MGGWGGGGQKRTRILRKFQFSVSIELRVSCVVRSLASVSTDSVAPWAEYSDHQLNSPLTHGGRGAKEDPNFKKVLVLCEYGVEGVPRGAQLGQRFHRLRRSTG